MSFSVVIVLSLVLSVWFTVAVSGASMATFASRGAVRLAGLALLAVSLGTIGAAVHYSDLLGYLARRAFG